MKFLIKFLSENSKKIYDKNGNIMSNINLKKSAFLLENIDDLFVNN